MQLGDYTIVSKLAEGGMGEVYRASRHGVRGFAREVAIKRISPRLAGDEAYVQMFLQEARIAALLDHPNVVQTHELLEHDGAYYLVMELVEGVSLARYLKDNEEPVPIPVAVQIAAQVAAGLHFVHEKQDEKGQPLHLIHRDISPPNILLSVWGTAKITDFGIAKFRVSSALSQIGVIKGKYSYLSPEQVRGDPIDHRSDIYSLGLVLYEMTTGRRAYLGQDLEVLAQVQSGVFTPPEQIRADYPDDLRAVVLRTLSYFPEDRYPSGQDLQRDLADLLVRRGVSASSERLGDLVRELMVKERTGPEQASPSPEVQPEGARTDRLRRFRQHQIWLVGGVAGLVFLLSMLVLLRIARVDEPPPPPPPPRAALPAPTARGRQPLPEHPLVMRNLPSSHVGLSLDPNLPVRPSSEELEPKPPATKAVPERPKPSRTKPRRRPGRRGVARPAAAGSRQPPRPARGESGERGLALLSDPVVDVYLGRRLLGRTPLKVNLPRRPVVLTLVNRELGLRARRTVEAEVVRRQLRFKHGRIRFRLKPGLLIQVDSRMVGRSPLPDVQVFEGRHVVTIINPFRYDKKRYEVTVKGDQVTEVPRL